MTGNQRDRIEKAQLSGKKRPRLGVAFVSVLVVAVVLRKNNVTS